MARGSIAKEAVIERIKQAFGEDFVGVSDGKAYVWAKENGERLQISLTLVATKTPLIVGDAPVRTGDLDFGGGLDFEAMGSGEVVESKAAEITKEEQDNVEAMMKALGLI